MAQLISVLPVSLPFGQKDTRMSKADFSTPINPIAKTIYGRSGGSGGSSSSSSNQKSSINNSPTTSASSSSSQTTNTTPSEQVSTSSVVKDIYGNDYNSFNAGIRRVGSVLNPFDWGTINLVNPVNPYKPIADVTIPTKVLTIGAEVGSIAYGAVAAAPLFTSAPAVAPAVAATGSASNIAPYLIGGAAGVIGGLLLNGGSKQTATTTPTQNITPTQTPSQIITPSINPDTKIFPNLNVPGSYNTINQNTISDVYNNSTQNTSSFQISNQNTTSSQTTTTQQSSGIGDLGIIGIAAVAILLMNK
jgi:hypothetical protein